MKAIIVAKKLLRDTHVIAVSSVLYLFVLAIAVQAVVGTAALLLGFTDSVFEPFTLGLALIVGAWIASVMGALTSASDVRQSAAVVAKRLGAEQATVQSGRNEEKALLKVVADVAIAYRCALPSIYVLPEESGINSLTVGSLSGDKAILITRGALRNLKEDELSAIVAHEFAHIVNENVLRNMKLMVAFSGLLALDQYGRLLVQKQYSSAIFAPLKLIGYSLMGFGVVGSLFAYILRAVYTRPTEMLADKTAVTTLKKTHSICSVLSKIKHSPERDSALHAAYVNEVRHLCLHAGVGELWNKRFNSSHPAIDVRLRNINPATAAAYAMGTVAALESVSKAASEVNPGQISSPKPNTHSPEVLKAANDAARTLGILDESTSEALGDKLAMTVQDPVTSLAALFSLFMPRDKEAHPGYLSAVAFAYNQNFTDTVTHIHSVLEREIHVQRLSVAKHATEQLKSKLAPEAARRVLLNIERLLKAQGLHNLMNYSAVQYLRRELSAEFPVLNKTANVNEPNAEARLVKPLDKMGEEFSRLVSQVLDATDLDRATADKEYDRVMNSYPNADYPRCDEDELADVNQSEAAYQLLLMQPRAIREDFIQHCNDIVNLNKEDTEPKRSQLDLLCASLGCSMDQDEQWAGEGFNRKIA